MKDTILVKMQEYTSRVNELKTTHNITSTVTVISKAGAQQQPQPQPKPIGVPGYVERGSSAQSTAQELESKGLIADAIVQYEAAIQLFTMAARDEGNEHIKSAIQQRISECAIRSQQLKQKSLPYPPSGQVSFGLKPGERYQDPMAPKSFLDRVFNR